MVDGTNGADGTSAGSGKGDLVHAMIKEVDHNRWTYLLAIAALAAPLALFGCRWTEGKAPSPQTGQALTADRLEAEGTMTIAELDGVYEEQLAAAESTRARRNTLALMYNTAIRRADEQTEENVALVRGALDLVANNPLLMATPMGVFAASIVGNVGQFMDRRRKDRVILQEKAARAA